MLAQAAATPAACYCWVHTCEDAQRAQAVCGPHASRTVRAGAGKVVAQWPRSHVPHRQHVPLEGSEAGAQLTAGALCGCGCDGQMGACVSVRVRLLVKQKSKGRGRVADQPRLHPTAHSRGLWPWCRSERQRYSNL